jgi:predicted NUDIX family phosphoesterase
MIADQVLVFEADLLTRLGLFQGYSREAARYLSAIFQAGNNFFMPRDAAERDVRYKQIIPYVVLRSGPLICAYTRAPNSTEQRLAGMRSIGLGGHIQPIDVSSHSFNGELYMRAAEREVREEVEITCPYEQAVVAVVNDDSSDVGRVHFGVLHVWELAEPCAKAKESKIRDLRFEPRGGIRRWSHSLEPWSQIALTAIVGRRVCTGA